MNRLTNNKINDYKFLDNLENDDVHYENASNYYDKLKQLEDIEEYLEIDLAVFFRCMAIVYEGEKKDDCIIKGENKLTYGHLIDLDYCKKKVVIRDNNDNEYVYGFASYGKSWELI